MKKIISIGLLILCLIGVILIANQVKASNASALNPVAAEKSDGNIGQISLRDKAVIERGKYGFRKKIKVESPMIVSQYLYEDYGLKNIWYGIYKDRKLTQPVKEIDMGYVMNSLAEIEEGAKEEDYPNFSLGHYTLLEPGTYYLGLYTSDFWDYSQVKFVSRFSPYEKVIKVEPGQSYDWSFLEKTKGEIWLQLRTPKTKKISMEIENYPIPLKVEVCDENKKVLGESIYADEYALRDKLEFRNARGNIAYIKMTWPAAQRQSSGEIQVCKLKTN